MVYFRSRGGSTGQTNGGARWNHFRSCFCHYAASLSPLSVLILRISTVSYYHVLDDTCVDVILVSLSLSLSDSIQLVYKQIKINLGAIGEIPVDINNPSWKFFFFFFFNLDRSILIDCSISISSIVRDTLRYTARILRSRGVYFMLILSLVVSRRSTLDTRLVTIALLNYLHTCEFTFI